MPDTAADRWTAAKALFAAALDVPTGKRRAFVRAGSADNDTLYTEVESLLAAHVGADGFLDNAERDRLRADAIHHMGLAPGDRLGVYRVLHEIARGGMGTVYLAERADAEFEHRVAIKLVTHGMDTEMVLRRFRQERQILAELQHPNIARLLEGGTTRDGLPYFVMEYIDGEPIDHFCSARKLSVEARLDLFREVCAAVQYAHQRLVVHRDIKPGNILVTVDGVPKLLDFGIARLLTPSNGARDLTAPHLQAMTPDYASPEQLNGDSVTTLADVYSLGIVLYRILTGVHPHPARSRNTTIGVPPTEPAPPSRVLRSLRGDIDTIVLGAMRHEPERRYASAQALSDDILRFRRGMPVAARADSWSYRAAKFVRRNRAAVALGSLAVLALAAGSAAFAWQAHVANVHRAVAERRAANVRRLALSLLFEVHDSIASLPGSTRARQLIVTRSLESLDTLAADDVNDPALRREIASAYLKVGDVQGEPYRPNLGQTAAALVSYGRASALLSAIVAANPSDARARRDLATTYTKIGIIRMRVGDLDSAVASERRAVNLMELALAQAPHDLDSQTALGDALIRLGDALGAGDDQRSLPRIAAAREAFTRALSVRRSLLASEARTPERIGAVAQAFSRLGYVGYWMGEVTRDSAQFVLSLANHRASQQLHQERLAMDSSSVGRRILADGWMDMAQSAEPLGRFTEALALLDRAGPIFASLAAADPANAEARRDLAYYEENRAVLLVALQRPVAAEAAARAAITTLTRLQRDDPGSVEEYYHLVHAEEMLGDALAMHASRAMARAAYGDARATVRTWRAAEPGAAQPARLEREIEQRLAGITPGAGRHHGP